MTSREKYVVGDYYRGTSLLFNPPPQKSETEKLIEKSRMMGNISTALMIMYYTFLMIRFSGLNLEMMAKYIGVIWRLTPEEIMIRYPWLYDTAWYGYMAILTAYMIYHAVLKIKYKTEYVEFIPAIDTILYTAFMMFSALLILVSKDPVIISSTMLFMAMGAVAFRRDVDEMVKRLNKAAKKGV